MGSNLKLLARFFVDVRRAIHGVPITNRGQWNRSRYLGSATLGGIHNLLRRLIENPMIVRFEPDANAFS